MTYILELKQTKASNIYASNQSVPCKLCCNKISVTVANTSNAPFRTNILQHKHPTYFSNTQHIFSNKCINNIKLQQISSVSVYPECANDKISVTVVNASRNIRIRNHILPHKHPTYSSKYENNKHKLQQKGSVCVAQIKLVFVQYFNSI